jgi:hypothetical protein
MACNLGSSAALPLRCKLIAGNGSAPVTAYEARFHDCSLRAPAGEARGLLSRDGVYPKAEELIYGKLQHGAGIRQRWWSVGALMGKRTYLSAARANRKHV